MKALREYKIKSVDFAKKQADEIDKTENERIKLEKNVTCLEAAIKSEQNANRHKEDLLVVLRGVIAKSKAPVVKKFVEPKLN